MENLFSFLADICGVLAFAMSIFAVNKINKIKKEMRENNDVNVSGNTTVGGDFIGRDKK